ncbi:MAG: methionyl-tRNA formyltransferase [Pseudomonadota bacterium]
MRVVFMGTPHFAVPALQALLASEHEVCAVVAQPDRPAGRGPRTVSPPTVEVARARGVPLILQPRAVRSGPFPERFAALRADVAVVVAYGRILTPQLLAAPRLGCINGHASLLPRYRGAAPIQWAVARGEIETGVTIMQMDPGLDTGPMLLSRAIPIGPDEAAVDLAARLADLTAELILEAIARLPELTPVPQEHALHTLAPPLRREDGLVDWRWPAQRIHDLCRGLTPWPGAVVTFRGEPLGLHATRPVPWEACGVPPGTVVEARRRLVVATGAGALEIIQAQPACRRAQPGVALICGMRIQPGEVFT